MKKLKAIRFISLLTILLLIFNAYVQSKQTTTDYSEDGKSGLEIINCQELPVVKNIDEYKATISGILKKIEIRDKKNQLRGWLKEILVLDDKFTFKIKDQNLVINYADLGDYSPEALKIRGSKCILEGDRIDFIVTSWTKGNSQMLEQLRQDLMFMKNNSRKSRYEAQLILFKPIAAKYRELKVKPTVSEEQRKFIVQANSFNEKKMYVKAIELYVKAIEIDQTAYPAGYSNLALLSAQINSYDAAIYYMKKYLLLEQEGSDARSAQDKIYEWEAQVSGSR